MERLHLPALILLFAAIYMGISFFEVMASDQMKYFSDSYQDAREKFLKAAQEAGARLDSFQNPDISPQGEGLFVDVALIRSQDATDFLVLISGTHGVEGFAGSGIQTGLLREGIFKTLDPHTGLIMVHALNPYGFSHLRRVNEDNIDLNRNFLDHTKPYPENKNYESIADVLFPKKISFWSDIKLKLNLLSYQLRKGKPALKRAVSGGQYSHPKGLFFGGHHVAWSNTILNEIVGRYLLHAKRVIFVDLHTGLGPFGAAEIIMNVPYDSPEYQRAVQMWGDLVKTTVSGDSVSVQMLGPLKLAVPNMIPQAEVTAVSLEFGTYPAKDVFLALRAENCIHHNGGDKHPNFKKVKTELLRVFYPNTYDWNLIIWNHGKEIVDKALKSLN